MVDAHDLRGKYPSGIPLEAHQVIGFSLKRAVIRHLPVLRKTEGLADRVSSVLDIVIGTVTSAIGIRTFSGHVPEVHSEVVYLSVHLKFRIMNFMKERPAFDLPGEVRRFVLQIRTGECQSRGKGESEDD